MLITDKPNARISADIFFWKFVVYEKEIYISLIVRSKYSIRWLPQSILNELNKNKTKIEIDQINVGGEKRK